MTRLYNDPAAFADEAADGFVAANERWVRKVHGGVARATTSPDGTVAVVIGGGSGHYPAFGGLVGHGLAAGAAMGNLFASPSAQQVAAVCRAAEHGGGVLLSYGNYAGDVLNFDAAARTLEDEGIPVRTVRVTDDVVSAPAGSESDRRGIAGDLCVFKVAGAAAEQGRSLDEVTAVAARANDRTRSFGVAFSGCSLPGAEEPLFEVPEGRMAIGMGIHGERGIDETDVPSADGLAALLVERLLDEVPEGVAVEGARVVPVLNGLGSVKYEELFVVYGSVRRRLRDAGVVIVEPEVGELVTSFDMAGVSLTLFWLDDELEELWSAPADTPPTARAVRCRTNGSPRTWSPPTRRASRSVRRATTRVPRPAASRRCRRRPRRARRARRRTRPHRPGRRRRRPRHRDAARLARGGHRRRGRTRPGCGSGDAPADRGDAWSDKAGGTSGAIWGAALEALGRVVGDESRPSSATVADAVRAATEAVLAFGAVPGDKTMVDASSPSTRNCDAGWTPATPWTPHGGRRPTPPGGQRTRARTCCRGRAARGRTRNRPSGPPTRARCPSRSSSRP